MKKIFFGFLAVAAIITGLTGCEQKRVSYNGPSYLMFSDTLYDYPVQETNEVFKVPVSTTKAVDYDRTFAVEIIDKESNAIEGKHYKLLNNTVVIKAGEMTTNVEVQGIYDNIGATDSLGFSMRLILPEKAEWDLYGNGAKVVLHKTCPFDINNFTGYCKVTSTYFLEYMQSSVRLIETELSPDEENTIILKGLYYDGYDAKLKFKTGDVYRPYIEMEDFACGSTSDAFGTIYGDGKLMMSQPSNYVSYYNTCENFVMQYVTLSVYYKDKTLYGTVGTYLNIFEWISDAEAEDMIQQGY